MLIIDITPLAINRTAMYFIVRDTVKHIVLSGIDVKLYALGISVDLTEFIADDFRLTDATVHAVRIKLDHHLNHGNLCKEHNIDLPNKVRNVVNLVFDPLYLLFVDVSLPTITFLLDLTPHTRPYWHNSQVSALYECALKFLYRRNVYTVSISESTARDLWANFGIPISRVTIISLYNRFSIDSVNRNPDKRIIFVGSLETRKNVIGLLEAFELSHLSDAGYSLHLIGGDGHGADKIYARASDISGVVIRGRLTDEDLQEEYKRCCGLAFPSYWEGFGLPALESLARGIPLLLADTGALPEVAGPYAIYVDPCNIQSIASGLRDLANCYSSDSDEVNEPFPHEIKAWVSSFSKEKYLGCVDTIISKITSISSAHSNVLSASIVDDSAPSRKDHNISRFSSISQRSRAAVLKKYIYNSRIVAATIQPVPGDSYSLDYLYCLQQERRLILSHSLSKFMSGQLWRYPIYFGSVIRDLIMLYFTNVLVKSLVNEYVIQKLSANLDKGSLDE